MVQGLPVYRRKVKYSNPVPPTTAKADPILPFRFDRAQLHYSTGLDNPVSVTLSPMKRALFRPGNG